VSHPVKHISDTILEDLRRLDQSGVVQANQRLLRGIYVSWNERATGTELTFQSVPGTLLDLDLKIGTAPDWLTFNIEIGMVRFQVGEILVLIADLSATNTKSLEMFVRTGRSWGNRDTHLQEPLMIAAEPSISTAFHTVGSGDEMAGDEGYHTLVIKLPKASGHIKFADIRMFVVPAEAAKRVSQYRLGTVA